ncbi:MAG TPA: DUF5996 family protein [Ktedonobacterales bacterium]|nr:DUF5996 family protein [Ktedonobacterales bacterium]
MGDAIHGADATAPASASPRGNEAADTHWPALPLAAWQDTYATLRLWTQVVGKVRLALSPRVNHWWGVTLYVTARGLTTAPMPYGGRTFEISFDFLDHLLWVRTGDGASRAMALYPRSVADFYREFMAILRTLGIELAINPLPQEIPNPIPCDEDHEHAAYDAAYVTRWWRILAHSERVMQQFRARFLGKCSPVHFFWGSFDLAVTRFSGRRAPERPGADHITREAYSHEVCSLGFWPGTPGSAVPEPAYYTYMAPEPAGYADAVILPPAAMYSKEMSNFILPYEAVRNASNPEQMILEFAQSGYEAGANLASWDRAALER